MTKENNFLIFTLDGHYFALDIAEVVRVYPALAVECPGESPPTLCGLFTVAGKNIPVLDLRYRLHLPARVVQLDDALVVAHSQESELAFFVDTIIGVRSFTEDELCDSAMIYSEMAEYVSRVTELDGHTVWIYTLDLLFADQDFSVLLQSVSAGVIS
ncbi:MAG: chemotaxis protein CheW [Deltaproteobacteria bacterium]|nr:chemotaxis protein CheW [Deltaproteobacteria bacterium]